jgi:CheY-like chemotaxis protein
MARVLIVDDDLGTVETFAGILRTAAHTASVALSGAEGLSLAMATGHDVILLDLRLPDISGLEFLSELRVNQFAVPVVMISAFATMATRAAAKQLGAVAFVEKPIDDAALLNIVLAHSATAAVSPTLERPRDTTITNHAATRWTAIVLPIVSATHDVPTIASWTRVTGHSRATLKQWCANAGLRARESLEFARALRLVVRYSGVKCDWFNALEIVDERTLSKFLSRAHFTQDDVLPDLDGFLRGQTDVLTRTLLDAIRLTLVK